MTPLLPWRLGGAAGRLLPDVAPGAHGPRSAWPASTPSALDSLAALTGPRLSGAVSSPQWTRDTASPPHPPSTLRMGVLCPPATCGRFSFGRNTSTSLSSQAGEKHYHPLCALCVRCGRMFAEGEEMYLQGKDKTAPPGPLGPIPRAGCEPCYLASWEAHPPARRQRVGGRATGPGDGLGVG